MARDTLFSFAFLLALRSAVYCDCEILAVDKETELVVAKEKSLSFLPQLSPSPQDQTQTPRTSLHFLLYHHPFSLLYIKMADSMDIDSGSSSDLALPSLPVQPDIRVPSYSRSLVNAIGIKKGRGFKQLGECFPPSSSSSRAPGTSSSSLPRSST